MVNKRYVVLLIFSIITETIVDGQRRDTEYPTNNNFQRGYGSDDKYSDFNDQDEQVLEREPRFVPLIPLAAGAGAVAAAGAAAVAAAAAGVITTGLAIGTYKLGDAVYTVYKDRKGKQILVENNIVQIETTTTAKPKKSKWIKWKK
ncbi:hypothetical protein GJ496_008447 [Pomphorhynchus laevis]|nr:hypothetical protein GJ496_008447 [Pomphorhynchus laevis]